jgi:cobalt-zinc-cadmium efflux system outer membrane protein
MSTGVLAQKTLTWDAAKRELEASNPSLRAARIGIQESRADEITAFLRPNPDLTVSVEQFSPVS